MLLKNEESCEHFRYRFIIRKGTQKILRVGKSMIPLKKERFCDICKDINTFTGFFVKLGKMEKADLFG